ncbi:unnamed protein product [Orchesella dallaii]|uniref:Gustatory receptor n=1 Tax=Orchesella dallaii TaxID=48710 RepID=A0ABP1PQA0_9HEXA
MSRFALGIAGSVVQTILVWGITEYCIAWWNISSLTNILNKWNTLETDLQSFGIFQSQDNPRETKLVRFRNHFFILISTMAVMFGISYLSSGLIFKVDTRIEKDYFAKVCFVLRTLYAAMNPVVSHIQDVLNMCLLRSCAMTFGRITYFLETKHDTTSNEDSDFYVAQLYDILHDVRQHCSQLGRYLSSYLLPSLVFNLYVSSAGIYVVSRTIAQHDIWTAFPVIATPVIYTCWSLLRLTFIFNEASGITKMEGELAETIYQCERRETDGSHKAEVDHFISICKSGQFGKYLNGWNEVFREMNKFTKISCITNINFKTLVHFRNKLFIGITTMAIIFGTLVASSLELPEKNPKEMTPLIKILVVLVVAGGTTLYLMEDGKILLFFKMSEHAFEQILVMSKEETRQIKEEWDSHNYSKIMKQLAIVTIAVREQCIELGKLITVQMLLSLACILYFSTAAFFIVTNRTLDFIQHGRIDPETMYPLVFAVFCLCRYWVIVSAAAKITEQVKRLHDLIVQNPTEISLSGYVTLNGRLILGILLALRNRFEGPNAKWGHLNNSKWMKELSIATIKVRQHCNELGKCITAQMLVSLAGILFYSTSAFFIVVKAALNIVQHGHVDSIVIQPVLIAVISFARYLNIVKGAVKITEKVQSRSCSCFLTSP